MSLRTEIFEQAETLQRLLSREMEVVERIAAALRSHTWRYVFLAARFSRSERAFTRSVVARPRPPSSRTTSRKGRFV